MNDDELMDQLLKDTFADERPQLSSSFDATLMQRVRPRRLSPTGRAALTAYAVVAGAVTLWLMRDLGVVLMFAGIAISAMAAFSVSAYVKRLAG